MNEPRSLQGREVLLFGAGNAHRGAPGWRHGQPIAVGQGVGEATALAYARHGAVVTCLDKDIVAAQATVDAITREGGSARAMACDVTNARDVLSVIEIHVSRAGRIDVLHNNIGIVEMGGPVECSEENFDKVIAVNLKGMFLTCKAVLPVMERQRAGAIVNITSFAAERFSVPWIAYAASKGGVNALTMGVAAQYAPLGIRCNAIAPGLLATPMASAAHAKSHADLARTMRARDAAVPLGYQGEGWDVGQVSVFLASDAARFITGQVLTVDGGSTIYMPHALLGPRTAGAVG